MSNKRPSLWSRVKGALWSSPKRGSSRVYAGAQQSLLTQDFVTTILSAHEAIRRDLRKLRDRSRALVRDVSYASRFVQSCAENIIGPDGIRLQVRVASQAGAFKATLNDEVEAKWESWCEPENCSVDGQLGFVDIEHLICETLPQDGEVLIRIVRGFPDNAFRFALQMIDADCLDETMKRAPGDGMNEIRSGVEVNAWGRPVAYWLWTIHPSEFGRGGMRRRERVLAEDLVYLGLQRRPGQVRAVPWFAPVLIDERMLAGWQEASITAARVGAMSQFFLTADPDKVAETDMLESSVNLDLEPGTMGQTLPPGYSMTPFDPKYPSAEFGPFRTAILQSLAAGLRVSALTFTGDLSQANYSSMRAGLLPEREAWKLLAKWLVRHFHQRVYREWVKAAVLSGALEVPPRELARVLAAGTWLVRGFPDVDPQKDLAAAGMEVAMGVNSLTNVAAARGRDFEDVMKQRNEEMALAAEYGVTITLDAAKPAPATANVDAATGAAETTDTTAPARALRLARSLPA